MATLLARSSELNASVVNLSVAQTGNGASTNAADRGPSHKGGIVQITTVVGGTPTCTYALQVSADGSSWSAATYADINTPDTDSTSTFALTTATTVKKIIKPGSGWRYFRITYSANTNVTNTADFLYSDAKRLP